MKFVDEVIIKVQAGKGGNGCLSFKREKYVAKGGPNGGDGGDGGSIYAIAKNNLNTLVDYCYQCQYKADNGEAGRSRNSSGASGQDLELPLPVGTIVVDNDTEKIIGDLTYVGQKLLVAQGGLHGLGNTHFKSSVRRAPKQTTRGSLGEERTLRLELKIIADVGLLGMPNAGKSTFIRAVSNAKPKVAEYPFTTLNPNLGMVSIEKNRNFIIADIPGIIEGASAGAGLGIGFLKHISRCRVLLHCLDVTTFDDSDPVTVARIIAKELAKFSTALAQRERWLVLNKVDLLSEKESQKVCDHIVHELDWHSPVYIISAITNQGTKPLIHDLMTFVEALNIQDGKNISVVSK